MVAQTWTQLLNPDAVVMFVLLIVGLGVFAVHEWRSLIREWNAQVSEEKKGQ